MFSFFRRITEPHASIQREDDRNLARLFASISLFIVLLVIPINLPFYFADIQGSGLERTFTFLSLSVIPEIFFFATSYFLARSRHFRLAGILMNVAIVALVFLVISYDIGNPAIYLILVWFLLAIIFGILSLPFAWQVIQFLVVLALSLLASLIYPWIPFTGVLNDVIFVLIGMGGSALFIGKFITHQESLRLKTITNLNEQLAERIANTTALLQNMGEGVVFLDQSNRISLANNVIKRLLQKENIDLTNIAPLDVFDFYTEKKERIDPKSVFPPSGAYQANVLLKVRGVFIPVALSFTSITQNNQPLGSVMVIHDSRKEKEIEEAKDSFFNVVSHELRTPLTKIRWSMDLLKSVIPQDQNAPVGEINSSLLRMNQVMETMLTYSQVASGTSQALLEKFDLSEVLEKLDKKYQPEAQKKGLALVVDKPQQAVFTSKTYLEQILDQYLSNAIKFTESGSVVLNVEGNTVSVKDTGPGIPSADQDKIFSSYYQQGGALGRDQEKGGLGLGLSLVKLLANKSNLSIGFSSEEGKGSVFFVTTSA